MSTGLLLDIGSAIGRGASEIGRITTIFFAIIILIQVVILLIGLFRPKPGYLAAMRLSGIIPAALSILCFQHEVGHYIQGGVMLVLAILGVLFSFRKIN